MSLQERRNAALKSSLSINSIRNSAASFVKGINRSQKEASEISEQTKKNNAFKRLLIRNDNKFFAKRRENVLRKEREDELEAATLQGSTRRQGNIIQKSTKGFLGRILDVVGIVIIGWFTTKLLPILPKLTGLITLLIKLLSVGKVFTDAISTFIVGIEEGISKNFKKVPKKPELEQTQTETVNALTETNEKVQKLNLDFIRLARASSNPNVFGLSSFADGTTVYSERGDLPIDAFVNDQGELVIPENNEKKEENNNNNEEEDTNNTENIAGQKNNNELEVIEKKEKINLENASEEEQKNLLEQLEKKDPNEKEKSIDQKDISENQLIKGLSNTNKQFVSYMKEMFGFNPETNSEVRDNAESKIKESFDKLRESAMGEKFELRPTDTNNEKMNEFNKRRNEIVLKKKYGGTGRPITIATPDGDVTYNPGDEGYIEAFNMIGEAMRKSGAITPISKQEVDVSKERDKNKILIVKVDGGNGNKTGSITNNNGSNLNMNVKQDSDSSLKKLSTLNLK